MLFGNKDKKPFESWGLVVIFVVLGYATLMKKTKKEAGENLPHN